MREQIKYWIISRGDEVSDRIKSEMAAQLNELGCLEEKERPHVIVSVGGDGTLLEAFHRYLHLVEEAAFVGVHTGRLGFYADWRPDEMEELVTAIASSELPVKAVSYPLLDVVVLHEGGKQSHYLALNECTVKTIEGSLVMDIEINEQHFETFRGDGLCISTPSGSTAYNKSLGGAIVHPSLYALQIAEMASINNRVYRTIGSPLILPKHHTCLLRPLNDVDYQVTVDHHTIIEKNVTHMTFQIAKKQIRFARFRPFPFWNRVRDSFIDSP